MKPLDAVCRKCKGQGVANAAASPAASFAPPPAQAQNPWQQAPPLNPTNPINQTNQMGEYQRPDYNPLPSQKQGGMSLNGSVILGAAICVFGIIATTVGYMSATPGKSYTIFWGAVVFGAFRVFRALTGE